MAGSCQLYTLWAQLMKNKTPPQYLPFGAAILFLDEKKHNKKILAK